MTIVAAFEVDAYPFLIGDMLISLTDDSDPHTTPGLPSIGAIENLPPSRSPVHGLRQKILIVSDTCAIGFAGDVDGAIRLLGSLKHEFQQREITPEVLCEFLDKKGPLLRGIALTGWVIVKNRDGSFDPHIISLRTNQISTKRFGSVYWAGSIHWPQLFMDASSKEDGFAHFAPLERAIAKVLTVTGALIREENASARPIAQTAIGGSYEVAFFDGVRFQKIQETTYLCWDAEYLLADDRITYGPVLVLKQFYAQDTAVVSTARLEIVDPDSPPEFVCYTHLIPPAWSKEVTCRDVLRDAQWTSPITTHSIGIFSETTSEILSIVEFGQSGIDFVCTADKKLKWTATKDFLDKLGSTMHRVASRRDCQQ